MRRSLLSGLGFACAVAVALAIATIGSIGPLPESLEFPPGEIVRAEVVDRRGERLSVSYENRWNVYDRVELHQVPARLRSAIVQAEDRRFFEHPGVDWRARIAAVWQNLRAGRVVRGASTLTEQVVRMLRPRPRTLWARWVEGFEARKLERRFSKGAILAFYLNQVPYARQRRGVVQAAHDLFDRDLDTLDLDETLALAILVRSPSRLDPRGESTGLRERVRGLAWQMVRAGMLPISAVRDVAERPFELRRARLQVQVPGFLRHVRALAKDKDDVRIATTLDARLQARLQPLLDQHVEHLGARGVRHGAMLVVDHQASEVRVWSNATSGSEIDGVVTPRQPGSTLKPFVYALTLANGWTAATLINDSPLSTRVGAGLHRYRNYSGLHRGPLRLRIALANSLNVPAVRAMQSLPPTLFYRKLRDLGFASLSAHPDYYGEGLALGNGEVTLYELVTAYSVLARGGVAEPIRVLTGAGREYGDSANTGRRHFDLEVATLVADILADADAREPEFGRAGVLDLPLPAAVKTGTSNDYRDAWAVGFSHRYTAGVWMGDLDRAPMRDVSGAVGPAVVLRAIFAELHRFDRPRALPLSRRLHRVAICAESGARARASCPAVQEWFRTEHVPTTECAQHAHEDVIVAISLESEVYRVDLLQPTHGLHLAMDPRIPDELESFEFVLRIEAPIREVVWTIDGEPRAGSAKPRLDWPVSRGRHRVSARVHFAASVRPLDTDEVIFFVR